MLLFRLVWNFGFFLLKANFLVKLFYLAHRWANLQTWVCLSCRLQACRHFRSLTCRPKIYQAQTAGEKKKSIYHKYKKKYSDDALSDYTGSSLKAVSHRYILFVFLVSFSACSPGLVYLGPCTLLFYYRDGQPTVFTWIPFLLFLQLHGHSPPDPSQ